MKVSYQHLVENIIDNPSIDDVSKKLFQLGHEHEIEDGIFDIEFTPNRGDCLSINGLLRELAAFYKVKFNENIYDGDIKKLNIDFNNHELKACPFISFLKIEINDPIKPYSDNLLSYFNDLNLNTNNFFTDISNYLSYEIGQPTHCYDLDKVGKKISLQKTNKEKTFTTLLGSNIKLSGKSLVFTDENQEILNLAGVIGGKYSACTESTRSVLIECAWFCPEEIIGKSILYDINSEAAHKFERGVDPRSHNKTLRRFIALVEKHAEIKNIELACFNTSEFQEVKIPFNTSKINKILGINIQDQFYKECLNNLGFKFSEDKVIVPSYRHDIKSQNDLAEEVARIIGYDSIESSKLKIPNLKSFNADSQAKIKKYFTDKGFYEVINNPFVRESNSKSIEVDNPLDSNKKYLRNDLKISLINNLLYNERRQKDSIKLFEISDVYSKSHSIEKKKMVGVIASGRIGKNYIEFSKKINSKYFNDIFNDFLHSNKVLVENISRESLSSKSKNEIIYFEIQYNDLKKYLAHIDEAEISPVNFKKYIPISDFPSSSRDLSFSIKDNSKSSLLEKAMLLYKHELIKEIYIFDYYFNEKQNEEKIGFRFIFQSKDTTVTDLEVDSVINDIICCALDIESVSLPGYKVNDYKS